MQKAFILFFTDTRLDLKPGSKKLPFLRFCVPNNSEKEIRFWCVARTLSGWRSER
jgi:hypothetical protein